MEKYLFDEDKHGNCLERCNVLDNGVMIGSVKCQECIHCVKHDKPCEFTGSVDWIVCSEIDKTIGKPKD